jgi:hypothetical protein
MLIDTVLVARHHRTDILHIVGLATDVAVRGWCGRFKVKDRTGGIERLERAKFGGKVDHCLHCEACLRAREARA